MTATITFVHDMYLFPLEQFPWFQALQELRLGLKNQDPSASLVAYKVLLRELAQARYADLKEAFADSLAFTDTIISQELRHGELSSGLESALLEDLKNAQALCQTDWSGQLARLGHSSPAKLSHLSPAKQAHQAIVSALESNNSSRLWEELKSHYQRHGTGHLARYKAFSFSQGKLKGIEHPVWFSSSRLIHLDKQLATLKANTQAFLQGFQAQHCLLYGPRGSGKSTAIRSLLSDFAEQGLRLIELSPKDLGYLNELSEMLRNRPHFYLLYVDDLSFEAGDSSYQPLKSILEGSLSAKATNTLIYATSNRRHLLKEQFSDRPDPLNDDVHGWDSQHEKLALADRFGLTITFPSASQQRYLEIVLGLADQEGLDQQDMRERAIRFAEWGNGYSGRTAQQFIDSAKAGLA